MFGNSRRTARASCISTGLRDRHYGKRAYQWVAEIPVRLRPAAQRNRPKAGDRTRVAGPPLDLRLIVSEASAMHKATCWRCGYLLTNVPAEAATATIALWYYWRWSIH